MKTQKILNYIASAIAIVHAGTTSMFSRQINQILNSGVDLTSTEALSAHIQTLPGTYFLGTILMLTTGLILFVFGIVTFFFNIKIPNTYPVKRTALLASVGTTLGVVIGLMPTTNTIYAVMLSLLYVIAGFYLPTEPVTKSE